MELDQHIEGLLFYKATPQKKKAVAKLLHVSDIELGTAIARLHERLKNSGLQLIETETDIQLATASSLADFIEEIQKQEVRGDIGKAGAETLAVILYRGPVSRLEIDTIRGVNSSYILRNLLVRGLIERSSKQSGGYQFSISPQLLAHLGISKKEDAPDYARVMDALEQFENANAAQE